MLCSLFIGLLASPLQAPPTRAPVSATLQDQAPKLVLRGSFPPGPVGTLLAELQSEVGLPSPKATPSPWPAWDDHDAWSLDKPWQLWLDSIALPEGKDASAEALKRLAKLAHSQSRSEDTWAYLQNLSAADVASLLPSLIANLGPDAMEAPFIIEPILPPIPVYDVATWRQLPPLREYRVEGLRIGQTTFTLAVQVPPEGVEVRFLHESGPELDLRVRIPAPANRTKRIEYVNWTRVESKVGINPVHTITLTPGSEELVLWARCMPRRLPWPKLAQGVGFPTDRSIEFTTTSDDASLPRLQAMARTFATLLDIDVAVSTNTPATLASSGRAPLRIDLAPSEFREVKIASLLSQMERNFAQLP